jgi:hypothetical protein
MHLCSLQWRLPTLLLLLLRPLLSVMMALEVLALVLVARSPPFQDIALRLRSWRR